jgi:YD repeat-containing protein
MKTLLIPAACAAFLLMSMVGAHRVGAPVNDLTAEKLNGKVRSYTLFTYETAKTGDEIDSDYSYKSTVTFNPEGNAEAEYAYNRYSVHQMLHNYDRDGHITSIKDQSGRVSSSYEYSRNAQSMLIERESFGGHMMIVLIYNKNNFRDTVYNYDYAGKFSGKVIYHYDSQHNMIEQIRNKADGTLNYRETYTYDKNHNQLSKTRYDATGHAKSGQHCVYDDYNNLITQIDSNDFYIGGFAPYDQLKGSDVHTRKFTYPHIDGHGNWLQEDAMVNGIAVRTMKRRIAYYR